MVGTIPPAGTTTRKAIVCTTTIVRTTITTKQWRNPADWFDNTPNTWEHSYYRNDYDWNEYAIENGAMGKSDLDDYYYGYGADDRDNA